MMSQRTSYCHIGRQTKQCITLKFPKIKCPRRVRCPTWHFPVPVDIRQTTHCHVMQTPHQQQWMTRQKPRIPCHFKRGPRGTPRQQGNKWKNSRRGTARKKLACVESTCPPHAPTWTLWNTMFYVTSHKNMLKLAMFSHVYEAFFSCLTWRILGDVPEKKFYVKANAHNHFFYV